MTLPQATTKAQAMLYTLDHTDMVGAPSSRKMAVISIQITMDAGQMRAPVSSELHQRIPEAGQYACLHAEAVMVHEKMLVLGSTKATYT